MRFSASARREAAAVCFRQRCRWRRANRAEGGQFAAGLVAAVFTALAIIAILWGAAHVVVGVPLRRQRPWARIMALMLGSIDLLLLPYGTALGTYTLWVLLGERGKQ